MKAKILILFLFLATICFGQEEEWGSWEQNDCYKGIWVRVKKKEFNQGLNKWWWHVQFQNRYNQRVAFSWVQYDAADGTPQKTNSRHTFETDEIFEGSGVGGDDFVNYMVNDVCFSFKKENQTWIEQCHVDYEQKGTASYAICDDGTPRYSVSGVSSAGMANKEPSNDTGTEDASNYAKLIVGKWKFTQSGGASDQSGKDLKLFDEEYDCYDIFEPNGRVRLWVGDCNVSEDNGTWLISGKILNYAYAGYKGAYEIVKLDKTTLMLKINNELDNGYYLLVFTRM